MKVRISIPGAYMVMDMEESQAWEAFHKLAESMWLIGSREQPEDIPAQEEKKPNPAPVEEALPNQVSVKPEVLPNNQEPSVQKQLEEKIVSSGYGGYLYIKCPVCGKVKGFCAKTRINNYKCDCGCLTKLKNMVPMVMKCECGRQARYLTNMTDPEFDVICYDCGAPVAVRWNEKKWMYETMMD